MKKKKIHNKKSLQKTSVKKLPLGNTIQKSIGWIKQLITKLFNFTKKLYYKEESVSTPKTWGKRKQINVESVETNPTSAFTSTKIHKVQRTRIHVPLLRPAKQIIAGVLLIINGLFCLASFATSVGVMGGLFFLLNAFICADYLWKQSKYRIVKEEED